MEPWSPLSVAVLTTKETAALLAKGMYLSKYKKQGEMVSLAGDAAAFLPLISAFEIS
jgi:hypothetical protein